jgi:hypothetical protein
VGRIAPGSYFPPTPWKRKPCSGGEPRAQLPAKIPQKNRLCAHLRWRTAWEGGAKQEEKPRRKPAPSLRNSG